MKRRKNWFLSGIYVLVVTVNVLSWNSKTLCDRIRQSIFRITQYVQGHISSLFPFSIGEFLLVLAVLLASASLALFVVLFVGRLRGRAGKEHRPGKFARRYYDLLLWVVAIVSVVMSTNCFVLYHCSSFSEMYMPESGREYGVKELAIVRDHVVKQCNALAQEMERDEDGYIVYAGDMERRAVKEMERLGETYPLLGGYYPEPKKLTFSGFFSQQYMMGYYFPFSMEANYNGAMYIANVPATICHELSHVKGFMCEDDANFIGYLACISSEDAFFRYSGYLSVLDYLERDLYESPGNSGEIYLTCEAWSPLVERDNIFLTREAWEEVEEGAILDTETLKRASRSFLETNLQVNGVEEGIASYGDVVRMLLIYYDGELY